MPDLRLPPLPFDPARAARTLEDLVARTLAALPRRCHIHPARTRKIEDFPSRTDAQPFRNGPRRKLLHSGAGMGHNPRPLGMRA
jgi:hypothetical protein